MSVALCITTTLINTAQAGPGGDAPRLWKASKTTASGTTTTIYLLAISHTGSTYEQGPYFQRVVVPAFMQADVLETESSRVVAEHVPECKIPLSGAEAQEVLREARDLVRYGSERRMLRTFQLFPQFSHLPNLEGAARANALDDAATLSEYGLIVTMVLNADFLRSDAASQAPPRAAPELVPVNNRLISIRPAIERQSIDGPDDVVNAYCDSGPQRIGLLKHYIESNDLRQANGLESAPAIRSTKLSPTCLYEISNPGVRALPSGIRSNAIETRRGLPGWPAQKGLAPSSLRWDWITSSSWKLNMVQLARVFRTIWKCTASW